MSDKEDFEKWWGCVPAEYKLNMTQDEKLDMWVWGAWQAAVKAERAACLGIVTSYKVPVGNSSAGELACEWTVDALTEIRDAMLERSNV